MDNLYEICKQLKFSPKLCVEVGAAHPSTSQLAEFIKCGVNCILFEANPRLFYTLMEGYDLGDDMNFIKTWPNPPKGPFQFSGFRDFPNVKLYNVAIFDKEGEINVFERNASSFIEGISSPATVNDGYKENLKDGTKVKCDTIDKYDNGAIDLLAADCEGCEYFALKYLISRPKLICLETHGQSYRNPFIVEIADWMQDNKYIVIDQTQSDTLFLREN